MKLTLRSPFLWIIATVLSGLMYFFAFHLFPQTFPIINLSITMDLEQALDKADDIAQEYNFGPAFAEASADRPYQSAAMFHTDNTVKTFVELEGGGRDAFVAMMDKQLYMPYTWRVRHFKEHEKNETTFIFTPDGTLYGFVETLSENISGAQLTENEARQIAENDAATYWDIDFSPYTLVETSQKLEIGGRLDHTFIYERNDAKIQEGLYRLKIVVSGDKTTTLNHFVKIPEAFTRRYAEMRSANNTISWAATIFMILLYFIGGCCFGLFYLSKHRWNIIKQPMKWAVFLSTLSVLTSINQLPFLWMHYHTALSSYGFLMQILLNLLISFLGYVVILTLIIMAAEGLTRRAFGNHPQLWLLTQPDIKTSYAIFGRTYAGYLLVGFNCAFVIGFYFFSTRYWGWWSPSEMLFDPNILATYAPWFSPIAKSLNAGFMEECLFRAIPLAGAALLGNRFGKRNWWIGAAFILQAIIFGAAHANYPMQPSYARLIELLVPSFIWGAIYLRFGLVTNIIAHFVYDVVWFSIPIFVSQTQYAYAYKITIIFVTLLPLLYVLYARIRKGTWTEISTDALNAAWSPTTTIKEKIEPIIRKTESYNLTNTLKKIIIGLGAAGLIAWIYNTPFTHDGVTITLNRDDAIATANAYLEEKNFTPDTSDSAKASDFAKASSDRSSDRHWKTLPLIFADYKLIPQIALQHKFIWQEGTKELYHQLLGNYLHPAHWTIRYAQFDTDIIQRAEEYKVLLYNNKIWQYYHQLPESTAGAELSQETARTIAFAAIQEELNINPKELTEISARASQLPHRKDWLFVFSDPNIYPLPIGQARISVTISGDQITNVLRAIHVPEEWERAEQHKQNMLSIVLIVLALLFMFLIVFAFYKASKHNKTFIFSKRLFFILCGVVSVICVIDLINSWQTVVGGFNTSLPLTNQLFQTITGLIISSLMKIVGYAAVISYVMSHKRSHQLPHTWLTAILGISSGLFVSGIYATVQLLVPSHMPLWPHYESLSYTMPLLASLTHAISYYTQLTIACSLLFMLIDTATRPSIASDFAKASSDTAGRAEEKNWLLLTGLMTVYGMLAIHLPSLDMIGIWIIAGALFGWTLLAMYRYVIRYDYALISVATSGPTLLYIAQQGIFNAYPGACIYACINSIAVICVASVWYWYVSKQN